MDELVAGIGCPVCWFAPAGNHHTWTKRRPANLHRDCCRQMHQAGDRAEHSLRVIDQAEKLAQIGLAAQVQGPLQFGMMMPPPSDLDKEYLAAKMIDHR